MSRWAARGAYGISTGAALGVQMRKGDPLGVTAMIPPVEGVRRTPVATGDDAPIGRVAVIEESTSSSTTSVFHVWIHAGVDADVTRRIDGVTERAHATRGGLADRVVAAIDAGVPDATLVWSIAGAAPPATRSRFDRASTAPRLVGVAGEGPVGFVGLALPADQMTNPVAWLRWLRAVVWATEDGTDPPAPPSVGFA